MERKNILLSLTVAAMLLVGCGGGGGETSGGTSGGTNNPGGSTAAKPVFVTGSDAIKVYAGTTAKPARKAMKLSLGTNLNDDTGPLFDFTVTAQSPNVGAAITDYGILTFTAPSTVGTNFTITVTAKNKSNAVSDPLTLNFTTVSAVTTPRSVIQTGATEDGSNGTARSFVKNANANVDGVNGLEWADKSINVPTDVTGKTYLDAKDYCTNLGGGWRLPTSNELLDAVDYGKMFNDQEATSAKVYDDAFATPLLTSWAEAENGRNFYIHNIGGLITEDKGGNKFMTRCVSGDKVTSEHIVYTEDIVGDTIDLSTGLEWSKVSSALYAINADAAKNYCEDLNTSTGSGWRLPNINELRSIVENGSISSYITEGKTELISSTPYNNADTSARAANWGIYVNADTTTTVSPMYRDVPYAVTCVRSHN